MPTLLRVALGAVLVVFLAAGVPVVLLSEGDLGLPQLVWALALTALALPPLFLAGAVSSWSDLGPARFRRSLVIALGAQAAAIVVLLVTASTTSAWLLGSAVLAGSGLLLNPALVAIGAAARRLDERRTRAAQGPAAEPRSIRDGWRRAGIGGVIGLVATIAGTVVADLLIGDGEPMPLLAASGFALAFAAIGASIGILTVTSRFSDEMRDRFGFRYTAAQRVGRIVAGKAAPADDAEQRAASEWAAVSLGYLPLQLAQGGLILVGMLLVQGATILVGEVDAFRIGLIAFLIASLALVAVVSAVRVRRLSAYIAAHPVPVD
jgi:hypothetical protein